MLVQVRRAYSGAEGKRVRIGTQLWVAKDSKSKAPDGVQTISWARYQQLSASRIVEPADGRKAPPQPKAKVEPRPKPAPSKGEPGAKIEPDSRSAARKAAAANTPPPPSKHAPRGGLTGEGAESSSSQAAPQTGKSTLKQRGVRRGQRSGGSPSTTPGDSSPTPTSSTPATGDGGGTTAASSETSQPFV